MSLNRYEEIEHPSDWAFRAYGSDIKELYQNAAYAIFALEGALDASSTLTRIVQVHGADPQELLIVWLSELLRLQRTAHEMYQKFDISQLSDTELTATVEGAPATPDMRAILTLRSSEVKLEQVETGWQAVLVVDV